MKQIFSSFCWNIFSDSLDSAAEEAEHVVQETSNANSDRTSNELVWKVVESII